MRCFHQNAFCALAFRFRECSQHAVIASKLVTKRALSSTLNSNRIDVTKMQITRAGKTKAKPVMDKNLPFGKFFTDHMLEVNWDADNGFGPPRISPHHNLSLDPAVPSLQYAVQCFEGMKAYKDSAGKIRLFRPDLNMKRFNDSCMRLALPTVDGNDFVECVKELLRLDHSWIPEAEGFSLYLRPTCIAISSTLGVQPATMALFYVIACPVGPYFKDGFAPIKILAESTYCRAWLGGTGANKVGGNYALGLLPQRLAAAKGYSQVLWLVGKEHFVTEVGAMNIFFFWKNHDGQQELITAPLDGLILPGVTRASILELTRHWGEFKVSEQPFTMDQVAAAAAEGRLLECFGAGTAAVVAPINGISYNGSEIAIPCGDSGRAGPLCMRLHKAMSDLHYGRAQMRDWSVVVDRSSSS